MAASPPPGWTTERYETQLRWSVLGIPPPGWKPPRATLTRQRAVRSDPDQGAIPGLEPSRVLDRRERSDDLSEVQEPDRGRSGAAPRRTGSAPVEPDRGPSSPGQPQGVLGAGLPPAGALPTLSRDDRVDPGHRHGHEPMVHLLDPDPMGDGTGSRAGASAVTVQAVRERPDPPAQLDHHGLPGRWTKSGIPVYCRACGEALTVGAPEPRRNQSSGIAWRLAEQTPRGTWLCLSRDDNPHDPIEMEG